MSKIIELIQDGYGFSVDSSGAAVQEFNRAARSGMFTGSLGNMLRNLLDIDCQELENEDYTRVQVAYVIQLAIQAHLEGKEIDPHQLYVMATGRAHKMIKEMPWVFAKKEADVKLDSSGKPKAKKGSKAIRSYEVYCEIFSKVADSVSEPDADTRKEIIEAFQNEEVMAPAAPHTKSGATTYYYNMKKKHEAKHG